MKSNFWAVLAITVSLGACTEATAVMTNTEKSPALALSQNPYAGFELKGELWSPGHPGFPKPLNATFAANGDIAYLKVGHTVMADAQVKVLNSGVKLTSSKHHAIFYLLPDGKLDWRDTNYSTVLNGSYAITSSK